MKEKEGGGRGTSGSVDPQDTGSCASAMLRVAFALTAASWAVASRAVRKNSSRPVEWSMGPSLKDTVFLQLVAGHQVGHLTAV